MKNIFFSIVVSLALSLSANATIIPSLMGGAPAFNGTDFNWYYSVVLSGSEKITVAGDGARLSNFYFMTIYDFLLTPATTPVFAGDAGLPAGASFAVSVQPIGITPLATSPIDSPAVANITLTYTGSVNIGGGAGASDITFGVLTARSLYNQVVNADFQTASQAIKHSFPTNSTEGDPDVNVTSVLLPSGAPEPSTMFLFGSGLIGLALLRRRLGKR